MLKLRNVDVIMSKDKSFFVFVFKRLAVISLSLVDCVQVQHLQSSGFSFFFLINSTATKAFAEILSIYVLL